MLLSMLLISLYVMHGIYNTNGIVWYNIYNRSTIINEDTSVIEDVSRLTI